MICFLPMFGGFIVSIAKIEIGGYKSIKHCVLDCKNMNLLIGENGSGKSNILSALVYFFNSLKNEQPDEGIYNYKNKFCNEFSISVTFDFKRLKEISKHNQFRNENADFNDYYRWIIMRQNTETLTLTKIKGNPIRWNHNWQYRQNIASLFPTYFLSSRDVNLTDWSRLWEIIGDLMKTHAGTEQEISTALTEIKDDEKLKINGRFENLSQAFKNADVKISQFTPKQYASAITTLLFKGNIFSSNEKPLESLSTGTNTSNYINLLIEVLKLISDYKLKEPIIIFDEPEISLHHTLIDRLTERIINSEESIQYVLASHSPRLLKNIIRNKRCESRIFHITNIRDMSLVSLVNSFEQNDNRPRTIITDQHACTYFSRFILSVEGATELELFSNEYLLLLFPSLKQIDVVEGMTDAVIQRIINPKQRNFRTNFLFLMDMDKVLTYLYDKNSFAVSFPLSMETRIPSESFYYNHNRTSRLLARKRIHAMAEKCRFHYRYPFYSCTDTNFYEFINLIKQYFLFYDTFVASTTIEGLLITKENCKDFLEFYRSNYLDEKHRQEFDDTVNLFTQNEKVNFLRLLFGGKSDFVLKWDQLNNKKNKVKKELYEMFSLCSISKTSGWVSEWLETFFLTKAGIDMNGKSSYSHLLSFTKDNNNKQKLCDEFKKSFPELFTIIEHIESVLQIV